MSACAVPAPATNLTASSATLNATGTYDGSAGHVYFEYSSNPADLGTGAAQRTPLVNLAAQPYGTPGSLHATITGLTPGTVYYYTTCGADTEVHASGGGDLCFPSPAQFKTPALPTVPAPPGWVTAIDAGNGSAIVSWDSASGNGSPVTSYTITPYIGSTAQPSTTITGSATSTTVKGLTNGTTYTFTVTATTSIGTGPASDPSNTVTPGPATPITVDAAPTSASVSTSQSVAVFSFTGTAGQVVAPFYDCVCSSVGVVNITMLDASGNQITAPGNDTYTLPAAGTYTLIFDTEGDASGTLSVSLWDNSPVTTTASGQSSYVPILAGEQTTVSFTGSAGEQISVPIDQVLAGPYITYGTPTVTVEDGAGKVVAPATALPTPTAPTTTVGPITLPSAGTYKLVFDASDTTALYQVAVENVSAGSERSP